MKINRSAFLYFDPSPPKERFAQCSTCRQYLPDDMRCAVLGKEKPVPPTATCALYEYGNPNNAQRCFRSVTPEEAGYINAEVRCENCASFGNNKCNLFDKINRTLGDLFDLNTKVDAQGCCNAWNAKQK